jgi:hypothetical protein
MPPARYPLGPRTLRRRRTGLAAHLVTSLRDPRTEYPSSARAAGAHTQSPTSPTGASACWTTVLGECSRSHPPARQPRWRRYPAQHVYFGYCDLIRTPKLRLPMPPSPVRRLASAPARPADVTHSSERPSPCASSSAGDPPGVRRSSSTLPGIGQLAAWSVDMSPVRQVVHPMSTPSSAEHPPRLVELHSRVLPSVPLCFPPSRSCSSTGRRGSPTARPPATCMTRPPRRTRQACQHLPRRAAPFREDGGGSSPRARAIVRARNGAVHLVRRLARAGRTAITRRFPPQGHPHASRSGCGSRSMPCRRSKRVRN